MSWTNYDDVVSQLEAAGLMLDKQLNFDARIQRWKVQGEDNERRGWSRLKEWTSKAGNCYIVGNFGVWHGNDDGQQRIEIRGDNASRLTDSDKEAMRAAYKEAQRKINETRKAEAKTAGRWAAQVWAICQPAPVDHDYLVRKQIHPHGLRQLTSTEGLEGLSLDDSNLFRLKSAVGALVVPMHDEHGNVCGIQFIYGKDHPRRKKIERDKEFWPSGMAMAGTFGLIGHVKRDGLLLIAEGFATAATLHESTGQAVAYAFAANNLVKAGKLIRKTNPRIKILFCADDDYLQKCRQCDKPTAVADPDCTHCGQPHECENPGVTAASRATAELEHSAWTKPNFTDDEGNDRRGGKKLTDFNDLAILTGIQITVANQINAALEALKWLDPVLAASAGAPATRGEGESTGGNGRREAVSVMSLDEIVSRFIFIDDDTGDFVFDTWTRSISRFSKVLKLLPAGVRGDDLKRHPVWSNRAVYIDQIGFDPAGEDKNIICNRWSGWPTTPKEGKCEILLDLLRYLCSGEDNAEEVFTWILRWLAYPIQFPGAKMKSAIVIHGPQGTGKSRFFEAYAKIFGEYGMVLNQGAIEDKFNSDWSDRKLFILADEIVARAEMHHLKNQLKNLITGDTVRVNPKNVAAHNEANHMNIVFASNEVQPVVLENDDRRHLVIWTPQKLGNDFYEELANEIDADGIAALHHHLLHLDLDNFKPWTWPPMTKSKRELISMSSDTVERFISDWRGGDVEVDGSIVPFCPCASSHLYSLYLRYCREHGEKFPRTSTQFLGAISKRTGWVRGHKDRYPNLNDGSKTVRARFVIPSDEDLNIAAQRGEDRRRKPGTSQTVWLSECFFAFQTAVDKVSQP